MRVIILFLGLIIFELCSSTPVSTNEAEARKFLDQINAKLTTFINEEGVMAFDCTGNTDDEHLKELSKHAQNVVNIVKDAKAFDHTQFKEDDLKRAFENLKVLAYDAIVGEDRYTEMLKCMSVLNDLDSHTKIESYKDKTKQLSCDTEVGHIFRTSKDPEELKYYWKMWMDKTHMTYKTNFVKVVDIIKEAAEKTGMTPVDFWMQEYDMSEMEHVMEQIKPFYEIVHAFVRMQLVKKYGEDVVKPNGPIPDHLYYQVLEQIWTKESVVDEMYPFEDLPSFEEILKKNDHSTTSMIKTAEKLQTSMGFEPIPSNLWGTQIKPFDTEVQEHCEARVIDWAPNFHMKYCKKMDFHEFLKVHGYLIRIAYAMEKKDLPSYFFQSHDLEYPVAKACFLSAHWCCFVPSDKVVMNHLLRMGINTMIDIPLNFVFVKLMRDHLAGHVETDDLNKHYWTLMDKYVGLEPPMDRNTGALDIASPFFVDLNENKHALKFDTEVMGYQMYKKLCEIGGQYPNEPLHKCNFYGHKNVGEALKKMMKLGSSKTYHDVLATLMPEHTTPTAEGLLEYYGPMKAWMSEKNHEAKVECGWSHTDKKLA